MASGILAIPPPPIQDAFVDDAGRLETEAINWFQIQLLPRIAQTPSLFGTAPAVELTGQNAAIGVTDLPLGSVTTGLYRVTTYLRITTVAGVTSSVQPVIGFVDDGVTCTMTGTALTANVTNVPLSQSFLVSVDAPGPITYTVNYASNPAGVAVFKLTITVERVQ